MRPYLGVSLRVFRALNRAFSAPRICTVEAGCLARFRREPENQRVTDINVTPLAASSHWLLV